MRMYQEPHTGTYQKNFTKNQHNNKRKIKEKS